MQVNPERILSGNRFQSIRSNEDQGENEEDHREEDDNEESHERRQQDHPEEEHHERCLQNEEGRYGEDRLSINEDHEVEVAEDGREETGESRFVPFRDEDEDEDREERFFSENPCQIIFRQSNCKPLEERFFGSRSS